MEYSGLEYSGLEYSGLKYSGLEYSGLEYSDSGTGDSISLSYAHMSDYSIGKYENFFNNNEVDRVAFYKAIYLNASEVSVLKGMVCSRKQGDKEVK